MKKHVRQSGFTIVEMLVAVAILGIVTAGFTSMTQYMRKELQFANRKVEAIELRRTTSAYLSDLNLCACQLNANGGTFDATAAPGTAEMPVTKIQTACDPTAGTLISENSLIPGTSTGLSIENMKVHAIEPGGGADRFRGRFSVEFKDDAGAFRNRGFELEIQFLTDPSTPDTAKKVVGCEYIASIGEGPGYGTPGSPGGLTFMCPDGQYMLGMINGEAICSAIVVDGTVSNDDPDVNNVDNPGPGCRGTGCLTGDYGVCRGTGCITNGNRCVGTGCVACGPNPSCSGTSCNTNFAKCNKFKRRADLLSTSTTISGDPSTTTTTTSSTTTTIP